jgi:hypothetical protein
MKRGAVLVNVAQRRWWHDRVDRGRAVRAHIRRAGRLEREPLRADHPLIVLRTRC